MEHLDPPSETDWDERRLWFQEREAGASEAGVAELSEQACALMIDLQASFCAGAWSAVIILAAAIVDAQTFHAGFPNDGLAEDRKWLRGLRNALLHEDRTNPAITIEDQWGRRREWEKRAKRAVGVVIGVVYAPALSRRRTAKSR